MRRVVLLAVLLLAALALNLLAWQLGILGDLIRSLDQEELGQAMVYFGAAIAVLSVVVVLGVIIAAMNIWSKSEE